MRTRRLEVEWLDELVPGDARAIRARADLRRVNALMGNARFLAASLRKLLPEEGAPRLADLGAGDGALSLAVARRLGRGGARLTLVDRAPAVQGATLQRLAALGWRARIAACDVLDFLASGDDRFDAVFANLFLHHFDDARLARLLERIAARTRAFVACEPRRSALALAGSRLLWAIGCNDVTRHDAAASVRAGFAAGEIGRLWPRSAAWTITERAAPPFGHLFIACAATSS